MSTGVRLRYNISDLVDNRHHLPVVTHAFESDSGILLLEPVVANGRDPHAQVESIVGKYARVQLTRKDHPDESALAELNCASYILPGGSGSLRDSLVEELTEYSDLVFDIRRQEAGRELAQHIRGITGQLPMN